MSNDHLVLAGGGHTHALILHRWCMYPHLKPKGLITLINRNSTTIYSGMVPGLIAGNYVLDDILINLRVLADQAGVSFIGGDIIGVDLKDNSILIKDRPSIFYEVLSLDVGAETTNTIEYMDGKGINSAVPIKPLAKALRWIEEQDKDSLVIDQTPFRVIGSGLSALEIVLALRTRWPVRPLQLQADVLQLKLQFKKALFDARVELVARSDAFSGPALCCTGSKAPSWLEKSNLYVDRNGRVLTTQTFQAINHLNVFAVGDCGVIQNNYRPPSGVWAVRAAEPLARNLERCSRNLKPFAWSPQRQALQLIGGIHGKSQRVVAWASWGGVLIGPHYLLWKFKQIIDKRFITKFALNSDMRKVLNRRQDDMACRGCAAKLPAKPLKEALEKAKLSILGRQPEDAVCIASLAAGTSVVQSVDGFPALISDPWLNGRLTTLHACSDIWASGAAVTSAQAVITLPNEPEKIQKELLAQSLLGIQSVLVPQGAKLIGGHTCEARSDSPQPSTLGIQIALSINGLVPSGFNPWPKSGLSMGDELIISRGLGTGVLFAAARAGRCSLQDLDAALEQLATSQHKLFETLLKTQEKNSLSRIIHACTDITGFGLLGHLEEMLVSSNSKRITAGLSLLQIKLQADSIPSLNGALSLLGAGYSSTLAPANRRAWQLLDGNNESPAMIDLALGDQIPYGSKKHQQIKELIVDPQTCGPLLVSCASEIASELVSDGPWTKIGSVGLLDNIV